MIGAFVETKCIGLDWVWIEQIQPMRIDNGTGFFLSGGLDCGADLWAMLGNLSEMYSTHFWSKITGW